MKGADVDNSLAWFLIAFAIFNTYMMLWATRVNLAVLAVFATLEATEILLAIGNFDAAHGNASSGWIHLGGWVGIATALVAWYTSAAGVINGMTGRIVLPVGSALQLGRRSPMPRGLHA
jgi:succinate-acetate transporter protein